LNFIFFDIWWQNIYKYIHIIGGSSYIGGCDEAYPITYLPGVTGITGVSAYHYRHDGDVTGTKSKFTLPGGSTRTDYRHDGDVTVIEFNQTMPGGSTRRDYIPGVGVGNVGKYATLQSPGGNGAIVLTFKVYVK